jgi:hypothetical protein
MKTIYPQNEGGHPKADGYAVIATAIQEGLMRRNRWRRIFSAFLRFYHDSAACLIRDGEIVAAAQEERFTRKKFDARFPPTPSATVWAKAAYP